MRAAETDRRAAVLLGTGRVSSADVRQALDADEALLEYLDTPDRLVVFVVRRNGVTVFDTGTTPVAIAARVRLARDMLVRHTPGPDVPVLSALHELLVAPAQRRGLLDGVRTLIVVPHGALTYLPFTALRDGPNGRFLVDRYDVVTLPSAASLPALRRVPATRARPAPNEARAVVLAPEPETLPGTRDEAREVARVLGERPLLGRDASERALRQAFERSAVIHVAAHAVLNARSPMFSRLELARGSGASRDDGRLELHELLSESVGSGLVFLSGCETALGPAWSTTFQRGEDYATLSQAFLQAGARNVVATLWRIEDHGAAEFASAFYRELRGRSPSAALAAAQRAMLRSPLFSAPYYWAAYQIEGAGNAPARTPPRKLP
jgi:CHAT domain-containing protein